MNFAQPAVLLLLLFLPLLLGLKIWGGARARKAASQVAAARLLPGLLQARNRNRDWAVFLLEMAALACFIISLARPQYGYVEEEAGSSGRSLLIAMDTSKSMLADDLKPSRLLRAQLAATDLVKRLRGDRIGLMPFAGNAFLYAPMTADTDALLESIDSLDAEIIPVGGSNLARAIDLAIKTFEKAEAGGQQVLVVFSDGESLQGDTLKAAARAKENKLTIICIGVGTQPGGTIPDPQAPGGYHRDRDGKVVVTRLEKEVLVSIANITDGLYLPIDSTDLHDTRIDLILSKIERTSMKGKITRKALERYRWPLGAGLVLCLAAWITGITGRHPAGGRRPSAGSPPHGTPPPLPGTAALVSTLLISLTLAFPSAGTAASADAMSGRKEQGRVNEPEKAAPLTGNPWDFYRKGDYANAARNFETRAADNPGPDVAFGRGAAAFKLKDYDQAVDAFGAAVLTQDLKQRAQAHYNLANSIYQRAAELSAKAKPATKAKLSFIDSLIRQLENSLENYQQSLILDPGNADTKTNHDITDDLIQKLRDLREQMAQQQGEGAKGKKKGQQKGKQKGRGQGQGQGEGEGEGDGQNGESGPNGKQNQKGDKDPGEEGDNGDQEEGKGAGPEGDEEKKAREQSNKEREGEIGSAGDTGPKPDADGQSQGNGKEKADGQPTASEEDPDNEVNSETGYSVNDARNLLEQFSDEDTKVRPQIESAPESRPRKDW